MNTILNEIQETVNKEFKLDDQGRAFCTIRGLARLCGVDHKALFKGGEILSNKLAELLSSRGFEVSKGGEILSEDGVPDTVAAVIIEYYALHAGARCTENARKVLCLFAAIGIRVWVQQSLGWQHSEPVKPLPNSVQYAHAALALHDSTLPAALKQVILDKMGDELSTRQLPSGERWVGVAQKAEEMGYTITLGNRTSLGKHVKKLNIPSRSEERLCNGTMRPINVYKDSKDLERAIKSYFEPSTPFLYTV